MVASIKPEDQFTHWRSEYEADIMTSLASLAGERMFFDGDTSSGVSGDLESATRLATLMEGYWGMGSTVSSHGVTHEVGIGGGGKPGKSDGKKEQDFLETGLGGRIEGKLAELLQRTEELLAENRAAVLALATALEANKTLTGEDVQAIIDGVPGPLVDGRPYHEPVFVEQIEAYHSEAVKAHKGHTQVSLSLPALLQSVPATVSEGNGEVPDRPDSTGNGEVYQPPAVAEGDGAGSVESAPGPGDPEPAAEGEAES
jgi:hypothetical protein